MIIELSVAYQAYFLQIPSMGVSQIFKVKSLSFYNTLNSLYKIRRIYKSQVFL